MPNPALLARVFSSLAASIDVLSLARYFNGLEVSHETQDHKDRAIHELAAWLLGNVAGRGLRDCIIAKKTLLCTW